MNKFTQTLKSFQVLLIFCAMSISAFAKNQSPPTISSFSPSSGPVGTLVTITGTNLDNPSAFTIGGVSAIVVSKTTTQIVGMVMPGANTGLISLNNAGGAVSSISNFTLTANDGSSFVQNGNKLVGSGSVKSDRAFSTLQGQSVSISADGNTAIVGSPWDGNNFEGAVWIYTRTANVWSQQGSKLVGSGAVGGAGQGYSVSISADGNTVAFGGSEDNGAAGATWIFTRSGNSWTQQGNKLVGTGAVGKASQGKSVSISADGNTAIIGAPNDNSGNGAIWVFTRTGSTWSQLGNKITGTKGFGSSVCISADGKTTIIGAPSDSNSPGSSWIYTRNGNTWTQQGNPLVGTSSSNNSLQGGSVSISADGNTVAIGGINDNDGIGATWVFTRSGNDWSQQGSKLVGESGILDTVGIGNSLGTNWKNRSNQGVVSISADGNTLIVGGSGEYQNGASWIFRRTGNSWNQVGKKMFITSDTSPYFGSSVNISADGKTIIVGGPFENYIGAAWVFELASKKPTISSFSPSSGPVGSLVTINGTFLDSANAITIGGVAAIPISKNGTQIVAMVMPGATTGAISITTTGGAVTSGTSFTQTPNSGWFYGYRIGGEEFIEFGSRGYSVSISADGNTAIVGDPSYNNNGAARIYKRVGYSWTLNSDVLVGTGVIGNHRQGLSVNISADGNTAIIGGDNSFCYIFVRNGDTWSQQSLLHGSGEISIGISAISSPQATSVSISADGNTAIVGRPGDNDGIGASWIFIRNGNDWFQQGNKLVGTGNIGSSFQGTSVSISADGNTAIVGAPNDNSGLGAFWVFSRIGNNWTQLGSKLVGSGAVGASLQGSSVSISADGNTVIIGAKGDNNGDGASWIFIKNGNNWIQQGDKLVGYNNFSGNYGTSVGISADGNTTIMGGPQFGAGTGGAIIFTRNGNNWTKYKDLFVQGVNNSNSGQGRSVSLTADGKTALVGGPTYFNPVYSSNIKTGAVWEYDLSNTNTSRPIESFSFTPTTGPVGTLVTINGTGLADSSAVTIGGVPAIVISKSATKLLAMVMPGATNGLISLSNASGVTNSASNFTVTPTPYPNTQQGKKLVSRDASGGLQGSSVSISADGNTALVGLPIESLLKGTAVVYVRTGNTWAQQSNKLTVTGAAGSMQSLGTSVSISADGNTAILGAPDDDNGIGAAWIFTRTAGVWSQQGTKLIGSGAVGNTRQGTSVAISADGNTVAISGIFDNRQKGAIWVFTRTANTWTQTGNKLVGTGSSGLPQIGTSLAISADGKTIIAGGQFDFASKGASWIFAKTGNAWAQQGAKLVGTGTTGSNYAGQGSAVALSADGNTAIVGSKYDNAGIGAAWIFTRSNGVWTQQGNKLTGANAIGTANYGDAVALSADGNTAMVGGWNDNANGTVYASGKGANWVYTRSGSVWTLQGSKLIGTGNSGNATQGYAVALSADGTTAVSGAPMDQIGVGAAWVYVYQTQVSPSSVVDTAVSVIPTTQKEQAISLQSVEMGIYPNPSNGRFTVSFASKMATTLNLTIVEAGTGRTMYAQPVNATKGNNQVPISMQKKQGLSTYIVHLEGVGVKYESKKLLIQ